MTYLIIPALLPIVTALVLMCKFKVVPGKAMLISWGIAAFFAFTIWKQQFTGITAASILGIFKSLDIIIIIWGAILLLNVLRESHAIDTINNSFFKISNDRRIQIIVIAWLFSGFIEGASGFGAAPALAAPLLAGLGFPVVIAVAVSLICNTLPVPFGAVGIPAQTAVTTLSIPLAENGINQAEFGKEMLNQLTLISGIPGVLTPLAAIVFMIIMTNSSRKLRSVVEIIPLALFSGIAYVIPWRLTAIYLGPELPSMVGAIVGLPLTLLMIKFRIMVPKYVWDFPSGGEKTNTLPVLQNTVKIPFFQAWMPYILLAVILLVLRMPGSPCINLFGKIQIILPETFGVVNSGASWKILNNPGLIPIAFIALVSALCWKIPFSGQWKVLKNTTSQVAMPAIAIAASVAIVQIMIATSSNPAELPGMLDCVAKTAANTMGKAYLLISPFIGIFGTFFAGSCTVSNILFVPLQFNTALLLDMEPALAVAMQNIGGGLGSMIRISGVIAACATVKANGMEGKIILLNSIPAMIMALLAAITAYILG